jgi:hypothetical protein
VSARSVVKHTVGAVLGAAFAVGWLHCAAHPKYALSTSDADAQYVVPADAAMPVPDPNGDACSATCAQRRTWGCAHEVPGGESCEDSCRRLAAIGVVVPASCP